MTNLVDLLWSFAFMVFVFVLLARVRRDRRRYREWRAGGCHDPEISEAPYLWIRRLEREGCVS